MSSDLFDVFHAFSGGAEMDGRTFVKCMKDSGLMKDSLNTVDCDLIFAKTKARGARKIDFVGFSRCLEMVAQKKGLPADVVMDMVCVTAGPMYEVSEPVDDFGPQRFFFDKSTYTGTHRNGGPTMLGGGVGEGDVVRDRELVNRDRSPEGHRRSPSPGSPLPMLLGERRPAQRSSTKESASSANSANRPGSGQRRGSHAQHHEPAIAVHGPERFYYDKSTYTGTWRNGGPSTNGSGVVKDGYSDLSDLVRREHVQDDWLNRKRRSSNGGMPYPALRSGNRRSYGSSGAYRVGSPESRSANSSKKSTRISEAEALQQLEEELASRQVPHEGMEPPREVRQVHAVPVSYATPTTMAHVPVAMNSLAQQVPMALRSAPVHTGIPAHVSSYHSAGTRFVPVPVVDAHPAPVWGHQVALAWT